MHTGLKLNIWSVCWYYLGNKLSPIRYVVLSDVCSFFFASVSAVFAHRFSLLR